MTSAQPSAGRRPTIDEIHRVGGHLALDFCNTTGDRGTGSPGEWLHDYRDLVGWSVGAGVLADGIAAALLRKAEERPGGGEAALRQALDLRETLHRTFTSVAGRRPLTGEEVTALNRWSEAVSRHRVLAAAADRVVWAWDRAEEHLDAMLWPVALAAIELLTSGDAARVKVCGGSTCGWLFLDRSPNRSRRWCDMAHCGNRAKVRRFRGR